MMQLTDIERQLFFDKVPAQEEPVSGPAIKNETSQSQNQIKMAASKSSHSSSLMDASDDATNQLTANGRPLRRKKESFKNDFIYDTIGSTVKQPQGQLATVQQ